mgnify:CR=1 FL=1
MKVPASVGVPLITPVKVSDVFKALSIVLFAPRAIVPDKLLVPELTFSVPPLSVSASAPTATF